MVMVNVAELMPPAFVAVTVILVAAATTVGVPDIIPVVVLNASPVGNVPVYEYARAEGKGPPVFVGVGSVATVSATFCKNT